VEDRVRPGGVGGGFPRDDVDLLAAAVGGLGLPNRIFDAVKAVVAQTGVVAGKTRRALDSTVLDDAVATQDTVTQLIGAIRRVRREVPGAVQVVAAQCGAHDYDDPGKPAIAWNDKDARDQLVDALVSDAHRLLGHLPEQELGPKAAEAVALLALIAGQDVEPVEGSDGTDGRWRIARQVAGDRVISTVDPDARHVHKSVHHRQDGFKAHVAIEPDTGIITDCALRQASGADNHEAVVGVELLAGEDPGLEVLGDSAYGAAEARIALADAGHSAVIKPVPLRTVIEGGFTRDDFIVDETAGQVTCPAGYIVAITRSRGADFGVRCRDCPLRARCTTSKRGRKLTLHEHDSVLYAARRQAEKPEFQTVYRQPANGRAEHRLDRAWQPQTALPRNRQERLVVAPPRRRAQSAPADHFGPRSHRHQLGHRLSRPVASPPSRLGNSKRRGDLYVDRKV
jgi:hypothetical protein